MKFHSLPEILKFAVAKEESSVKFYRNLAAGVKKADMSAVFEIMARQEEKHIEAIKLECIKLGYTVLDSAPAEDGDEPSAELDELAGEMTYLDALRLGIQKERAAFELYAELMTMTDTVETRRTFLYLAEEEMRHVLQLERELETLTQPHKG